MITRLFFIIGTKVLSFMSEMGEILLMFVRSMAEQIIAQVQPKDYLSEILAICYWVTEHVHYVSDPAHVELIKDPQRHLEETAARGQSIGDCDDIACLIAALCLVIGRIVEFVVVGFGEAGQYSHVFARVKEPRSEQWLVFDPVAGTDPRGMLDRVTTFYTVSCDEFPGAVRSIT